MDNGKPSISDLERDPKLQIAKVKFPNGVYEEFDVDRGCHGSELFRHITSGMKYTLGERKYFSLSFCDSFDGRVYWIDNDREIDKQLRAPHLSRTKNADYAAIKEYRNMVFPWDFSFGVILYPKDPSSLVDDVARHYMFMQLLEDILTGRLPAPREIHTRLGAIVAQLQFGDAPITMTEEYSEFMSKTKLIPESVIEPEVHLIIAEHHTQLRGITTTEAQNKYMDICKDLPLYGLNFYFAKDEENRNVTVGCGAVGINIYHDGYLLKNFPLGTFQLGGPRGETVYLKRHGANEDDKNSTATLDFVDNQIARQLMRYMLRYDDIYKKK